MKLVVLDGYALNPGDLSWSGLEQAAENGNSGESAELTVYDRTPPEQTAARIQGAFAVWTNKTIVGKAEIEQCPSLRYLGVLATGYNIVDVKAAREKNIPVCNVPGYSTASVAQLAFALLLEICHHAGAHSDAARGGKWAASKDYTFWDYPLIELAGKTLGIIGLGSIGKAAARIAGSFGMEVIAFSRTVTEEGKTLARYTAFDELLAAADVISLHCPETEYTRGLINREAIEKMKDGVIIINTSRGGLINEADLARALNAGKVYAAGLDVLSAEPAKADNPLLSAKNCVITPHIAWAPLESRRRLMALSAGNFRAFLEGKPENVVN